MKAATILESIYERACEIKPANAMNPTITYAVQRKWDSVKVPWLDVDRDLSLEHANKLLQELRATIPDVTYRIVKRVTEETPI